AWRLPRGVAARTIRHSGPGACHPGRFRSPTMTAPLPRASLFLVAALLAGPASWARAADRAGPEGVEFFEKRIRPRLVQHCYPCHSTQAGKAKGKLLLDSRDAVRKGGSSGPAVVPGDPAKSVLLKAVRYEDEALRMPPKGQLSAAEIADLEAWVKLGA